MDFCPQKWYNIGVLRERGKPQRGYRDLLNDLTKAVATTQRIS